MPLLLALAWHAPAFAQSMCTEPEPAARPPAAKPYFLVIIDTSGSMAGLISPQPSCAGFRSDRFGHARCAVQRIVNQFSDRAEFGLMQFASQWTSTSPSCFAPSSATCFQAERNTDGRCYGCGPVSGTDRFGGRLLVPVQSNTASLLSYVDNVCTGSIEAGPPWGSTPLYGALSDARRYFETAWTNPDNASLTFPSPLIANTCAGRKAFVILLTDGAETCDTPVEGQQAARSLYVTGVTVNTVNYKVPTYVVNFQGNVTQSNAIAAAGGTGAAYPAVNESQLFDALSQIMTAAAETLNGVDDDCNGCVDDGWSDLALFNASAPAEILAGEVATFEAALQNEGPTDALVEVTGTLPPATQFGSIWNSAGWSCTPPPAGVLGGTVTCNGLLPAGGAPVSFTIEALVPGPTAPGSVLSHTFAATPTTTLDPSPASVTVSTTVSARVAPALSWPSPPAISYGTPLGPPQLNATADVAGSFTYTPAAGEVLPTGAQTLSATFTPDDPVRYLEGTVTTTLVVNKAVPVVSWPPPADVVYGTPLDATQLNATADVPGVLLYSPAAGTILPVGSHVLGVELVPDDSANYENATETVTLTVHPAMPAITWPPPVPIVYGMPLDATQLNAAADVPGHLDYTPAAGALLPAGDHRLAVTFTPDDPVNYLPAGATVPITVLKATPVVSVTDETFGYDGHPHPATGSVTGVGHEPLGPLTFTYNGLPDPPIRAGTYAVEAIYAGDANYEPASATATLVIEKATPGLDWRPPSPIVYGTPLGAAELDATADVPGTFAYTPAAGTVLPAGTHTLEALFAPADPHNYEAAAASTTIEVTRATPVVSVMDEVFGYDGDPHPATGSVTGVDHEPIGPLTFTYNGLPDPPVRAGTYAVEATYAGDANYEPASATATLVIEKATPVLDWPPPSPIVYGTPLGAAELDATADVHGTFAYTPVAGTVLDASAGQPLSVEFTPADQANYLGATIGTTIDVLPATPVIAVTGGTFVYDGQPHAATGTVTGVGGVSLGPLTFTYNGDPAAPVEGGTYAVSASYAGDDNYESATDTSATIVITPATPSIVVTGGTFTYDGAPHPAGVLVIGLGGLPLGPVDVLYNGLPVVPVNAGAYAVEATYAGDRNYEAVNGTATITIDKAMPVLAWPAPAPIVFGTPLGPVQLAAMADVPGSFAYTPPAGTVLPVGTHALSALFTPADTLNYEPATASAMIDVRFGFCLLYDPTKAAQPGSTIPIKLALCDASGAWLPAGVTLTAQAVVGAGTSLPATWPGNANPLGVFMVTSDGYHFNLKTQKDMPEGSYGLVFTAGADPTPYQVPFAVKER